MQAKTSQSTIDTTHEDTELPIEQITLGMSVWHLGVLVKLKYVRHYETAHEGRAVELHNHDDVCFIIDLYGTVLLVEVPTKTAVDDHVDRSWKIAPLNNWKDSSDWHTETAADAWKRHMSAYGWEDTDRKNFRIIEATRSGWVAVKHLSQEGQVDYEGTWARVVRRERDEETHGWRIYLDNGMELVGNHQRVLVNLGSAD